MFESSRGDKHLKTIILLLDNIFTDWRKGAIGSCKESYHNKLSQRVARYYVQSIYGIIKDKLRLLLQLSYFRIQLRYI